MKVKNKPYLDKIVYLNKSNKKVHRREVILMRGLVQQQNTVKTLQFKIQHHS